MFAFIKNLFKKKEPQRLRCSNCKHRAGDKRGWFCKENYIEKKKNGIWRIYYTAICGNKKVKLVPKGCPLK